MDKFYPKWPMMASHYFSCFLFIALSLFSTTTLAQVKFDKDGMFIGKADHLRYSPGGKPNHQPSALSAKEVAAIKLKIALLVQQALISATDPDIVKQYKLIWKEDFVNKYISELVALQDYLKEGKLDQTKFEWVPSPTELMTKIFNKPPLDAEAGQSTDLSIERWYSVKKDLLNEFIIDRWKQTLKDDKIDPLLINESYLNGWKTLETWYGNVLSEMKEIKTMDTSVAFDLSRLVTIEANQNKRDLATQSLVKNIQASTFLRKWLWYTGGIITMNPLGAANPGWAYPISEKNSFLTPRLAVVQDSLNRSTFIKDLTRTKVIYNDVQLLIVYPKGDPKNDLKWLVEYNAADHFKKINIVDIDKVEKETYQIAVHNIAKGETVTITQSETELKDQSSAITAINELADQVAVITQFTKPNLAVFNTLRDRINPMEFDDIQMKFNTQGYWALVPRKGGALRLDSVFVTIPDTEIPLTKTDLLEDKRRILGAKMGAMSVDQRKLFERILPKFLKDDQYNFIDYTSTHTIQKTIDKLVERFQSFLAAVYVHTERAKEVSDKVLVKKEELEPYIAIYGRSLPTDDLDGYLDEKAPPAYFTKLYTPTFPDAPKKLNYFIFNKPEGGEQKQIVKQTTKITKRHLFDVSIGLAYTFQDYDVVSQSGKNMPTVDRGDRFNFIAGLHWYFSGLNKIDDGWWEWNGRWSLYAGLSITNALDNFYGGLSYDPTPGIRIIGGVHVYKDYRFKIVNDQIAEKATGAKAAGPFISIALEPATVGKAIGLFK